jgi:DNA replication protein DnaC
MQDFSTIAAELQQRIMKTQQFALEYIDCEKCGSERKEMKTSKMILEGGKEIVICLSCDSKKKAIDTEEEHLNMKQRQREEFYFEHSLGLSPDLQAATFQNFEPDHLTQKTALEETKLCVEKLFSFSLQNTNVLMQGEYGIGKSHLGAAAAKAVNQRGCKAIFIDVPMLLTEIKSTWHKNSPYSEKDVLKWILAADLLVLDDIGSTMVTKDNEASKLEIEKLFQITNGRQGKATIYTTNLEGAALRKHVGDRVLTRIINNTKCIPMAGECRRKPLELDF